MADRFSQGRTSALDAPLGPSRHRDVCRLCDSPDVELVVPLAPTPLAGRYVTKERLGSAEPVYRLDVYMCRSCGHVQLLDVVDPRIIWDDEYTYVSSGTPALVRHFDDVAATVVDRYRPAAGALVVDIGSNDGSLLRCFQERGSRVLGVDATRKIAERATREGIETLPAYFTPALARTIRERYGAAAVVTAFNVFSHDDDLGSMADGFRELMGPEGVFVFEVSYLLDIVDASLLGTIFHEHLSYHSVGPFIPFLRRHGLELIDVYRVPIQGGSIVGTAQRVGGPHAVSPSVAAAVDLERRHGLDRPATLREAGVRLHALAGKVGGALRDLKAQGRTIAAYGAARSGTTFMAQMGLGGVIGFIVDDDPFKQGKYMAGDHTPVLPTAAMYERRPDYVLILAWIHADKILRSNRRYLDDGGRFVVCYPDLEIVDAGSTPSAAVG